MRVNCPDLDAKSQLWADFTQGGLERRARQPAEVAQDDIAVAIKHDRVGEGPARVAELARQAMGSPFADQNRIVHLKTLREFPGIFGTVDGYADEFHAIWPVFCAQGDEIRDFLAAWRAPTGPEIHHEDLATPLR